MFGAMSAGNGASAPRHRRSSSAPKLHAYWYLALAGVLYASSVVMCFSALVSQSWIETVNVNPNVAPDNRRSQVDGKDDLQWYLMAFALAFGLAGVALLSIRFWMRGYAWFYDLSMGIGAVQFCFVFAAWVEYRNTHTLTNGAIYGVGDGLAQGTYYAVAISVLIMLFHRWRHPSAVCHQLTRNQQHMVVSTFVLFVYIQLGAVFFERVEGWDFRTASQFCLVTLTTIGYGDAVPQTTLGRASLFVYAPLGFAWIGYSIKTIWTLLLTQLEKKINKSKKLVAVGSYTKFKDAIAHRKAVIRRKIMLNAALFFVILFVGAAVFSQEELHPDGSHWTFFESLYCSLITLTTIGYGDFAPLETNIFFFSIYVIMGLGALGVLLTGIAEIIVTQIEEELIDREEDVTNQELVRGDFVQLAIDFEVAARVLVDEAKRIAPNQTLKNVPSDASDADEKTDDVKLIDRTTSASSDKIAAPDASKVNQAAFDEFCERLKALKRAHDQLNDASATAGRARGLSAGGVPGSANVPLDRIQRMVDERQGSMIS